LLGLQRRKIPVGNPDQFFGIATQLTEQLERGKDGHNGIEKGKYTSFYLTDSLLAPDNLYFPNQTSIVFPDRETGVKTPWPEHV
jgi:hypothetical protein